MIFLLKQIEKITEKNVISKDTSNKLIEYFENYNYTDNSFSEEDRKLIKIENKKGNFDIFSDNDLLNAKRDGILNDTEFTDILITLKNMNNSEGLASIVKKEYTENDDKLCFETTPLSKVIILSFLSCGIYNIILSINYWKILKSNFGYNISPVWRGLFDVFTNFKLFPIFFKYFKSFKIKFAPIWFAIIYIICRSHVTLTVNDNNFDLYGIHIHIADIIDIDSILGFFALSQNFKIIADMNSDYSLFIKAIIFAIICLILALNLGGTLIYSIIQNNINKINREHYPKAIQNNWNIKNIIWSTILALLLAINMVGFIKTINNNNILESSQENLKKGNVKFNYSWQTMSLDYDLSLEITPPNSQNKINEMNLNLYLQQVESKIKQNWEPLKEYASNKVTIKFIINGNGELQSHDILESSGIEAIDNAALKAIEDSSPFEPLPKAYKGKNMPIEFKFDYMPKRVIN